MRTTSTHFTCNRCRASKTHDSDDDGYGHWPKGWSTCLMEHMRGIPCSEENTRDVGHLCPSCTIELDAVKQMGRDMVKSWFNERNRSKTTT